MSGGTKEIRLLVRDVIPVLDDHYVVRELLRLSIKSASYVAIAKEARNKKGSIIFAHSHPGGFPDFSRQDDAEESTLMDFFVQRIPDKHHGSLVIFGKDGVRARVWINGKWRDITRIRVIGSGFRFIDGCNKTEPIPEFFDRQVRAFGKEIQQLLGRLHIGVVGAGGTGSAVIEQLVRLGVGIISIFDHDVFEPSNVNRVYGSTSTDGGELKVDIAKAHIKRIGVHTRIFTYGSILTEDVARNLRACDLIFGCTDKQAPRGILVQLAIRYLIPLIDVGVIVDSEDNTLRGVDGRVTTFYPGEACLFCRERISGEIIRLESLPNSERESLVKEGYAPELENRAPAVIPFTTAVAAQAVTEMLHRLTGFMGSDRQSTEVIMRFHATNIRRNHRAHGDDCVCAQRQNWGRGDSRDFLGLSW